MHECEFFVKYYLAIICIFWEKNLDFYGLWVVLLIVTLLIIYKLKSFLNLNILLKLIVAFVFNIAVF